MKRFIATLLFFLYALDIVEAMLMQLEINLKVFTINSKSQEINKFKVS